MLFPLHFLEKISPEDRRALGKGGLLVSETLSIAEAKSERELQEQICALLRRRDVPFIRPAMFKKSSLIPGWPDITFVYRGIGLGWECKSASAKPTPAQIEMHTHMERAGWRISIVRSLRQAMDVLNQIDSGQHKSAGPENPAL